MYHGHSSSFQYWHPNKLIIKEHTCIAVPHREKQSHPNEKKHLDLMLETISLSHYRTNYRSERAVNTEEMNKKLQSWHTGCYMFGYSIVARFTHLTQGCVYPDLFLKWWSTPWHLFSKVLKLELYYNNLYSNCSFSSPVTIQTIQIFPQHCSPLTVHYQRIQECQKAFFFFLDRIV